MTGRPAKRGDVIAALNRLVDEQVLTGFRTDFFDKHQPGWTPEAIITVAEDVQIAAALERANQALQPL